MCCHANGSRQNVPYVKFISKPLSLGAKVVLIIYKIISLPISVQKMSVYQFAGGKWKFGLLLFCVLKSLSLYVLPFIAISKYKYKFEPISRA